MLQRRSIARWTIGLPLPARRPLLVLGLLLLALGQQLPSSAQAQAVAVPFSTTAQPLTSVGDSYEVQLDTLSLPPRPEIHVAVSTDPDLVVDVEVLDCDQAEFYGNFSENCFFPTCVCEDFFDWVSGPGTGSVGVVADLWRCLPVPDFGKPEQPDECTVRVTAVSFGPGGPPANVDVDVTAAERVTSGTVNFSVDTSATSPVSVDLEASRDATIYAGTTEANGMGQTLQAGGYSANILIPPTERRALIAFDLEDGQGTPIPYGSEIQSAAITLNATEISTAGNTLIELYRIDAFRDWTEGPSDPAGNERSGDPAQPGDVTWFDYDFPNGWSTPGGDFASTPSASLDLFFATGPQVWTSPQLTADVQDMVDTPAGDPPTNQGWVFVGPLGSPGNLGYQFDSREAAIPADRPTLSLTYQETAGVQGDLLIDEVEFNPDADNLRWIYDPTPGDAEAVTVSYPPWGSSSEPRGRCEILDRDDEFDPPFAYTYLGPPGFVGHDCCVFTGDTSEPGGGPVVSEGCGQAVFHLQLSTSVPVPDFDGDGIGDPCDNCYWIPNGPEGGTCVPDTGESDGMIACQSDLDCPDPSWNCSKSQEDQDQNRIGNACPEPGMAMGLAIGLLGLAGLGRPGRPQRSRLRAPTRVE